MVIRLRSTVGKNLEDCLLSYVNEHKSICAYQVFLDTNGFSHIFTLKFIMYMVGELGDF